MRIGTPGFTGARLREARDVRGISAISLSEMVDVSPQQIYNYENDKSSPSPATLAKISRAINLPESFFLLPPREASDRTIFYRSMSAATKTARNRVERRAQWLRDITDYSANFVTLPSNNLPDIDAPKDPLVLADQDIENIAEEVRKFWQMSNGPIANMVLLLENQGVIVTRDALGADTLDSYSTYESWDTRPYIGIGTDKGTAVRWRFDAAHELGHLLLHSSIDRSLLTKTAQFKRIEEQAHRFASAFLVPLESFCSDLYGLSLDSFHSIKLKWNTSIAMMIIRARQADLLSEDAERRLWIAYNRRKWRKQEPYDDTMEVEEPRLLRRAFELILDEGQQTPSDVLTQLALAAGDVETLAGLPAGYLSEHSRVRLRADSAEPSARIISIADRRQANR